MPFFFTMDIYIHQSVESVGLASVEEANVRNKLFEAINKQYYITNMPAQKDRITKSSGTNLLWDKDNQVTRLGVSLDPQNVIESTDIFN